jgi:hypothetical protein
MWAPADLARARRSGKSLLSPPRRASPVCRYKSSQIDASSQIGICLCGLLLRGRLERSERR